MRNYQCGMWEGVWMDRELVVMEVAELYNQTKWG